MKYNKDEILHIIKAKRTGAKGWFIGHCNYCGDEKFAVIFGNVSSFVCKKCGKHGTIYDFLRHIKRLDLATPFKNVEITQPIKKLYVKEEEVINYKMPFHSLPIGWKRIYDHEYLNGRGWEPIDYERYPVGITKLDPLYKQDYLIFPLYDEDGETKGFLARTTRNNEWVKEQNEYVKKYGGKKYLRYANSSGTDFGKYLGGINEINENTVTVILVEGLFDKTNVDKKLGLFDNDEIKCNYSFGKKISREQIKRLRDKGIFRVILLYDPDAMKESKEYSSKLNDYFEVDIGYISIDKDPGEMEQEELLEVLNNTENIVSFYFKLEKRKLL